MILGGLFLFVVSVAAIVAHAYRRGYEDGRHVERTVREISALPRIPIPALDKPQPTEETR